MDRLDEMMRLQRELQERINGYTLEEQDIDTRIDNVRINVLALTDELHECLGETGWKPWATSRHINWSAAQRELVDAWHFFMNLMLHLEMTPVDLWQGYHQKHKVNFQRQEDGYDGVSGKCPRCHRDLAETDVKEVIATSTQRVDLHCVCGAYLGSRPV